MGFLWYRVTADCTHVFTQGFGYPYSDGKPPNRTETSRFSLMDTNGDGVLDDKDDPYAPYWPGDEYVDWIGLSSAYRGRIGPNASKLSLRESSSLTGGLTAKATMTAVGAGVITVTSGIPLTATASTFTLSAARPSPTVLLNFLPPTKTQRDSDRFPFSIPFEEQLTGGSVNLYKAYSQDRQKPLLLWNAGAAYYVNGAGANETSLKLAWLSQILQTKRVQFLSLSLVFPMCDKANWLS